MLQKSVSLIIIAKIIHFGRRTMNFPDYITHIPSVNNDFENLSSDVFIIRGKRRNYVYDVGNGGDALEILSEIPNKIAIISHFHHDHIMNIDKLGFEDVIQGRITEKYTKVGRVIEDEMFISDGVNIRVFFLTNSHAKDFLVLEVGDYLFLSDSVYCTVVKDERVYNANLLKKQIEELEKVSAKYFVVSHDEKLIYKKDEIINRLKSIYSRRNPKSAYIPEKAGD